MGQKELKELRTRILSRILKEAQHGMIVLHSSGLGIDSVSFDDIIRIIIEETNYADREDGGDHKARSQ